MIYCWNTHSNRRALTSNNVVTSIILFEIFVKESLTKIEHLFEKFWKIDFLDKSNKYAPSLNIGEMKFI